MSFYTLFIATVINVNKELPVKGGLTLDECRAAATQALLKESNYARCRPAQPEMPVVYVKLPSGLILEVQRQHGGYRLPTGHSPQDEAFAALALGTPSSGVHGKTHGADRPSHSVQPETLVAQ
jgi:hypothetical protein